MYSFGGFLLASDLDLFGIDHDDKVARIEMRRIGSVCFCRAKYRRRTARRPNTAPSASITCHFALSSINFRQIRFIRFQQRDADVSK